MSMDWSAWDNMKFDIDPATGLEVYHSAGSGQLRYRCPMHWESGERCVWDTHDLDTMRKHVKEPHTMTGKAAMAIKKVSKILDSDGKPFAIDETLPENEDVHFAEEDK